MRNLSVSILALAAILIAGCSGGGPSFPQSYLLYEKDLPSGLELAPVPQEAKEKGITTNPAKVPTDLAKPFFNSSGAAASTPPEEVWGEWIQSASDESDGLILIAARWAEGEALDKMGMKPGSSSMCQYMETVMQGFLRDDNVLVIIVGDDELHDQAPTLVQTLMKKADGLTKVCP